MPSSSVPPSSAIPPGKGTPTPSIDEMVARLSEELSLKDLWRIASRIGMAAEQFENLTGASPHKLRRGRGGEEKIDRSKNDPILRCAKVFRRVVALCNKDETAARNWLNAPAPVLKNRKPIEVAQTIPGAKNVEALVAQLEKAAGLTA